MSKRTSIWSFRSSSLTGDLTAKVKDGSDSEPVKERESLAGRENVLQERLKGLNKAVEREEAKLLELERRGTERVRRGFTRLAAARGKDAAKVLLRRYYGKLKERVVGGRKPVEYHPLGTPPPTAHCHNIVININTTPTYTPSPPSPPRYRCHPVSFYPPCSPPVFAPTILIILIDFHQGICHGVCSTASTMKYAEYTMGVDTCLPYFLRKWGLSYSDTRVCVVPDTEDRDGVGFAEMVGMVGGEGCIVYTPGELMSTIHGAAECVVLNCNPSVLSGGVFSAHKLSLSTYTEVPYPLDSLPTSLAATIDHIHYRSDIPPATLYLCYGVPRHILARVLPYDPIVYPTPSALLSAAMGYLQKSKIWCDTVFF